MAECVQQNLEEMLPELEELECTGVFSRNEIRVIIRKRREFEYRLQKRIVQKIDFLRYMQYEINLDTLKKKRRSKLRIRRKLQGEYAVTRRIHHLFQNALKKFVGDLKLWIQYIEFCKHVKSTKVLGQVFARVLQFHSNKPDLWIMAAKWEFEDNKNIPNSRSLLQRGLRVNSTSQQLWLEYFRMELLHLEKVRKRQQILKMSSTHKDPSQEAVSDAFLTGKVPEIVYKKAIECIPDDIEFRLSFIEIYRLFEDTKDSCDQVYQSMLEDFPNSEEVWNAVACRPLDEMTMETSKETNVISDTQWCELELQMYQLFERAVDNVPTEKMWEFYITACMTLLTDSSQLQAERRVKHILELFSLADSKSLLGVDSYRTWVNVLLQIEETEKALSVCKRATKLFKTSAVLWSEYLRLQTLNQGSSEAIHTDFASALKSIKTKESLQLWNQWLEWCLICNTEAVESVFELSLESCAEVSVPMRERYVEWTLANKGIKKTRKLYKRLSVLRPASLSFYRKCIDLELIQISPSIKRVRNLYEAALDVFGSSHPGLWLEFIRLELQYPTMGAPQMAGDLYWRALKVLNGDLTSEFVSQYSLLQAGKV